VVGEERNLRVTTSIGVAIFDGHPDYTHLVERADKALYAAKKAGRNRTILG
jgi:diguanylate cyclase